MNTLKRIAYVQPQHRIIKLNEFVKFKLCSVANHKLIIFVYATAPLIFGVLLLLLTKLHTHGIEKMCIFIQLDATFLASFNPFRHKSFLQWISHY